MIYADNAATTKISEGALEAMQPYLREVYGNPSSIHRMGQQAKSALEDFRSRTARLLHCRSREVFFTAGGSESDNQAILSAVQQGVRYGRRHIVTTAFEHHAVLHTVQRLQRQGYDVTYLPIPENGVISADQVKKAIRDDTCLVTVMFANNEIGTIQPISRIGAVCRKKGVLFHTDAVQAAGHIPIDVEAMNIDMLSLSAHKFHGPKGAGVLYAHRGVRVTNLIEGGAQERNRRGGTENLAAIAGMTAAFEESVEKMHENAYYVTGLRNRIIDELSQIPRSVLNGDPKQSLPGIINFCFDGIEGETLLMMLDGMGICASSGSACTSGSLEASHVLLALGRSRQLAYGSLRLSLSQYTTEEDAQEIIDAVKYCIRRMRRDRST